MEIKSNPGQPPSCQICESKRIKPYCKKNSFTIYQCINCKCGFLSLIENPTDLNHFYQNYYSPDISSPQQKGYDNYFSLEKSIQATSQKRVLKIKQHLAAFNKPYLLDIGCGPGFFLKEASNHFDVKGIDIAGPAVKYAREELFLNVIQSTLINGLFEENTFDVITLWDSIEHLPDPVNHVQVISKILKPGGVLALTTGDIESPVSKIFKSKWHLMTVPEHLFFFSKQALTMLFKRHGLEVLHCEYSFDYYTVDYLFERLTKSLQVGLNYRRQQGLRNFLSQYIVPFNLFDIMFIIAQKSSSSHE